MEAPGTSAAPSALTNGKRQRLRLHVRNTAPSPPGEDNPPAMVEVSGLQDDNAQVRLRVMTQALVTQEVLPADAVAHLALTDPDAQVRLAALSAVSLHPDLDTAQVERLALEASHDTDPAVQSAAMELLQHLEVSQTNALGEDLQTLENEANTTDPGQLAVPAEPE